MSSTFPAIGVPQQRPPMSFWSRWMGVYFSPSSTFADVVRQPDFLFPLITAGISAVALTETLLAKIGMERIVSTAIEQSGRASRMSAEQIEAAVQQGARVGAIFAHLGGLLGTPILLLIVAGLGLASLNGIFGAQLNFRTAFAVACYAYLPHVLAALMGVMVIVLGDAEQLNPQNPLPSNVGFFLNPFETSKSLYALSSSIDIFTLWFLALLGIGFSQASGRKVKSRSVFLIYFGLWMMWVLGKVGMAVVM